MEYIEGVPTVTDESDLFAAIADPRRRQILDLLAANTALPVNDLVLHLDLPQPAVSKHLSILRQCGLVAATRRGRSRVYHLEARALKPAHAWISSFERFWDHHLTRIKQAAERAARREGAPAATPSPEPDTKTSPTKPARHT